ncbi:hypothetical protein [Serratia bockelmannii]|uniref:hypothetical protein n=1 Tax=Serratia bockelmannii TaxID=2703793 RepID=UPI003FA6C2FA
MPNLFKFTELSNKFNEEIPQRERHQFGEPVVSQLAREFSPNRFSTESEERESNDKLKVRQVYWLLDEAGDQMEFLNLTLTGLLKNKFGKNALRIISKDLVSKGVTYSSSAMGATIGTVIGGPAGGAVAGVMSGSAGAKAYKNLERGFASKNPKWKIKTLYPSTNNIDKSISNAYLQRGNKSVRNNDAPKEGFSLAMKTGAGVLKKLLPGKIVFETLYSSLQAYKGLSSEKIRKINQLITELETVVMNELESSIAALERLNTNELKQGNTQKLYSLTKFKKIDNYLISKEELVKKREGVANWAAKNRQILMLLEADPSDNPGALSEHIT